MSIQEAFYKTIYLLENYCECHSCDEDLISILADLDCTIFQDGLVADQATYVDWEKKIIPYVSNGIIDDNGIIKALLDFLTYYEEEFGYDLKSVINFFRKSENY